MRVFFFPPVCQTTIFLYFWLVFFDFLCRLGHGGSNRARGRGPGGWLVPRARCCVAWWELSGVIASGGWVNTTFFLPPCMVLLAHKTFFFFPFVVVLPLLYCSTALLLCCGGGLRGPVFVFSFVVSSRCVPCWLVSGRLKSTVPCLVYLPPSVHEHRRHLHTFPPPGDVGFAWCLVLLGAWGVFFFCVVRERGGGVIGLILFFYGQRASSGRSGFYRREEACGCNAAISGIRGF